MGWLSGLIFIEQFVKLVASTAYRAVQDYLNQQRQAYNAALAKKKSGDKNIYAPKTIVHWLFRQVILSPRKTLPSDTFKYLLSAPDLSPSDDFYEWLKRPLLKNRPDVRYCLTHHVGTEFDLKQLANGQTFVVPDFCLNLVFYIQSRRKDYLGQCGP